MYLSDVVNCVVLVAATHLHTSIHTLHPTCLHHQLPEETQMSQSPTFTYYCYILIN